MQRSEVLSGQNNCKRSASACLNAPSHGYLKETIRSDSANAVGPRSEGLHIQHARSRSLLSSIDQMPSPPSSPDRTTKNSSVNSVGINDSAYPTPPDSEDELENTEGLAFPVIPRQPRTSCRRPFPFGSPSSSRAKRRILSTGNDPDRKVSPDRYITSRSVSQNLAAAFRSNKALGDLTVFEKSLRHQSASPDPFGSLPNPPAPRQGRTGVQNRLERLGRNTFLPRSVNSGSQIQPREGRAGPQVRQVSAGAVWNVGGTASNGPEGPVRAVSDGRGGLLSGGSNAPMFTAPFLHNATSEDDVEALSGRIAAALDIDRVSRLIDVAQMSATTKSVNVNAPQIKSGRKQDSDHHHYWSDGQWIKPKGSRKYIMALEAFFKAL